MKRIGIMGGSFDPVHNAHLELALKAQEQYMLTTVLFIPAGFPVRKLDTIVASPKQRLEMLELACSDYEGFEISTLELERQCVTYTIDTLRELSECYTAEEKFYLIVGWDAAVDLGTWKDSAEIAQRATVLYAERPGSKKALGLPFNFDCYGIEMPQRDISSSMVRNMIGAGEDVSELVPARVLTYINECGLYGKS